MSASMSVLPPTTSLTPTTSKEGEYPLLFMRALKIQQVFGHCH